jgi:lipopolysaccharide/colanic/teichoic acid biosynthesis glycosyltransferase
MFDRIKEIIDNRSGYYIIKRGLDVVIASILLLLLSPLMLLIAVAILIYSPGPVFFTQERVGGKRHSTHGKHSSWNRVTFLCLKFRTMHINADSSLHKAYIKALIENDNEMLTKIQGEKSEIHKLVKDPRITRPGKLLRKLSLDELPQLLNVLRGDMSLVGPRPAIPYEVDMYRPWHLKRLEAQPGITGLQQVSARSTADFDQQVRLDLEYIEHQSLWLDLKIILKTPFVILSTKGAG